MVRRLRWLLVGTCAALPTRLIASEVIGGLADETPHKSAALDMLAGLEAQPAA